MATLLSQIDFFLFKNLSQVKAEQKHTLSDAIHIVMYTKSAYLVQLPKSVVFTVVRMCILCCFIAVVLVCLFFHNLSCVPFLSPSGHKVSFTFVLFFRQLPPLP